MSHSALTTFEDFRDLESLLKAFELHGWKIERNTKMRTYAFDPSKDKVFDYVAVNPAEKGYDIGIIEHEDGTLGLECDYDFRASLIKKAWHDVNDSTDEGKFGRLKQAYSLCNTRKFVESHGGSMRIVTLEDGTMDAEIDINL